ncbi:hypothetical protein K2Q08_03075 [Patescibacteria group bacterium]|nr:hypothetical protein [Patescibacteria group bacterium]
MPEATSDSTQNKIQQRLAELPQDVRDAVLSAQLGERLRAIGQKHSLHIDQIGVLEDEVMLVMLGFFEPEELNNQIATQLRIPAQDASAIVQEVNEQIFLPIRESMKRFSESKRTPKAIVEATEVRPVSIVEPQQNLAPVSPTPVESTNIPIRVVPPSPAPDVPPPPPMPNAEKMLTETTIAKPGYKNDPYREPIE